MQSEAMIGLTYGRLRVTGIVRHAGRNFMQCVCSCGEVARTRRDWLLNGKAISCGCYIKEVLLAIRTTHGMRRTPEYRAWVSIKNRCHNPRNKDFENYGGRGIVVCDEWRHSFENFFRDMGTRPSSKHSVDRFPNNSGNYEAGNCRWATMTEQQRNKRSNVLVEIDGQVLCASVAAKTLGVSRTTIARKIKSGALRVCKAVHQ